MPVLPVHRVFARLLPALVLVAASACAAPPGGRAAAPDCGSFDAGHNGYDATGLECFWSAFSARTSARWAVMQMTIEGDPVPSAISFDPAQGIVVTRDMAADEFSSRAARRLWTWRCTSLTKKPWTTDASRYFFAVAGCSGDGAETSFP